MGGPLHLNRGNVHGTNLHGGVHKVGGTISAKKNERADQLERPGLQC